MMLIPLPTLLLKGRQNERWAKAMTDEYRSRDVWNGHKLLWLVSLHFPYDPEDRLMGSS